MKRTFVNREMNEMVTDINIFCTCMKTAVLSQRDGRLAVQVERSWVCKQTEDLSDKTTEPNAFLGSMCGCDVLGFCG